MKNIKTQIQVTLVAFFMLFSISSNAQRTCGHTDAMHDLQTHDSTIKSKIDRIENYTQNYIARKNGARNQAVNYQIPVVVHILYNTQAQNISDAQIQSQIDSLNKDYNLLNRNFANTPAYFKTFAASTNFTFKLATIDPKGRPTNGITRTATSVTQFSFSDAMKYSSSGGIDAWNPDSYLNIWVCKLNGVLGFAYGPSAAGKDNDGVVISNDCFGTIGNLQAKFNLGRTATHEIGHYFNLNHIWGDKNDCTGDDKVSDTPQHKTSNFGCPTYPSKLCAATNSNGEMFMNYMDYSDDVCMTMFSQGQADRMVAALTGPRASLLSSQALDIPILKGNDVSLDALFCNSNGQLVASTNNLEVNLINVGTNVLTSASFKIINNAGNEIFTQSWIGNIASLKSATVSLLNVPFNNLGVQTYKLIAAMPNNLQDENNKNDTLTFSISNPGTATLPYVLDFENATLASTNLGIENPDKSVTWNVYNIGANNSTKSIGIKNYVYNDANGQEDNVILPALDIVTGSKLNFDYAHAVYTSSLSGGDSLQVSVSYFDSLANSFDCNTKLSKEVIWAKGGTALITANPKFTTQDYIPKSNEWVTETVDLSKYVGKKINIHFTNITDWENNTYLDNIKVAGLKSGLENDVNKFTIYPNPASNKVIITSESNIQLIHFLDLSGKIGLSVEGNVENGIDISALNNGIYIVKVVFDGGIEYQKIIKN